MTNLTFFDLEATDKNPVGAEILTGYFKTLNRNYELIDEFYVECRPDFYRQESFEIHGISRNQALNFPDKKTGLRSIVKYLKERKDNFFICHANGNIFGVSGYFDWQVINMEMIFISQEAYYWFQREFYETKVISTHTIAKKVLSEKKLSLDSLAGIFGLTFQHHNCIEDTNVTIEIYKELMKNHTQISDHDLYELGNWRGLKTKTGDGIL